MIVTTGNEVTGYAISSYIGIVRGIVVRSPSIGQGFRGAFKSIVGGNNAADLLDVQGGLLTLQGTLTLNSADGLKPTAPLNFLDDSGNIANVFGTITGNIAGAQYAWALVGTGPTFFQVTIT